MSKVIIVQNSAFQIYRYIRSNADRNILDKDNIKPTASSRVPKKMTAKDLKSAIENNYATHSLLGLADTRLDVLCSNKNQYRMPGINLHYTKLKLPRNSFWQLSEDLYISSPELLFCQMAEVLSPAMLALLGLELCGTFSLSNIPENRFCKEIRPLTSIDKIRAYIAKLDKLPRKPRYLQKAKEIAKYLADGSASPQESRLWTALCLPPKYGGFGLGGFKMNAKVLLSKEASSLVGAKYIRPDISNEVSKIAIEYDSDAYHDNELQNRKDKMRINALHHDGWKTYNFVPGQFKNVQTFRNLAFDILRANSQSTRIRIRNFDSLNRRLLQELSR